MPTVLLVRDSPTSSLVGNARPNPSVATQASLRDCPAALLASSLTGSSLTAGALSPIASAMLAKRHTIDRWKAALRQEDFFMLDRFRILDRTPPQFKPSELKIQSQMIFVESRASLQFVTVFTN